jgi:NAD-dependent DNA ligase/O-acetyl-ADP-ribose deacetylase (regulator of RNase III)
MSEAKLEVVKGDITKEEVDAIVNAAHSKLSGGGGVDGAIHRSAGPRLLGECLNLYGCPTGQSRITAGYKLPAKYVIHTVGPVWRGGLKGEAVDLENCYYSCLDFMKLQALRSIAFPCISSGAYAFPADKACKIACGSVKKWLDENEHNIRKVKFVCFDEDNYKLYCKELGIKEESEDSDSLFVGMFDNLDDLDDDGETVEFADLDVDEDEDDDTLWFEDDDGAEDDKSTDNLLKEILGETDESCSKSDDVDLFGATVVMDRGAKTEEIDVDQQAVADAIKEANEKYRLSGDNSGLTDAEYDYLQELSDDSELKSKVGVDIEKNKVALPVSMGSLNKCKTLQELKDWMTRKGIALNTDIAITPKFDGLALVVSYVDGEFVSAATRGDGTYGQDVSDHFRYTKVGKKKFPKDFTGEIVGEAIMKEALFQEKYLGKYKTARNMVAGVLNRDKITEELEDIDFMAYKVFGMDFDTKYDEVDFCNKHMNFGGVYVVVKEFKDITEKNLQSIFKCLKAYQIDGLVLDVNDVSEQESIGSETNSLNPGFARAWKPESGDDAQTIVLGMTWKTSKVGAQKPVIQIDPVDIGGVTISNVTGINAKFLKDNKIDIGAAISVIRSGDVIPKVTKTLVGSKDFSLPTHCQDCKEDLSWSENDVDLLCTNQDCLGIKLAAVTDFFPIMSVEEVGEGIVKQLFAEDITTVEDILNMSVDDFEKVDGFQRRKAEKTYEEIHKKMKNVSLEKLQHASNMFRGLGSTKLAQLKEYDSKDNIPSRAVVIGLDGYSDKTTDSYLNGIEGFWEWAEKLPITSERYVPPVIGVLTGQSVKGSGSSKEDKADKLNVEIMDWEELTEFLDNQ